MKPTQPGFSVMNSSNPFSGNTLGDCLRAAEADADRFHGARAQASWQGPRPARGAMLAAAFTLLALAGAGWLALDTAAPVSPRVTLAAAPHAPSQWFTPAADGPEEEAADTPSPASAPVVGGRPPALADTTSPLPLDGGDVDLAASMPASVLSTVEVNEGPRVAPMNAPTLPDAHDSATGEPEPAVVMPSAS